MLERNGDEADCILYHIACLPKKYRLRQWKNKTLISAANMNLLSPIYREVVYFLVDKINQQNLSEDAQKLLTNLYNAINHERMRDINYSKK